jgi:ubiquinone biosynthesis monooxygenase Coq7
MLPDPRSLLDACLVELDAALRTLDPARAAERRPAPAAGSDAAAALSGTERDQAARLMRVNHAGEIAAQALYRGQALTARDAGLRSQLLQAAAEEQDHLAWCAARTRALGQPVSRLAPLWYAGSFALGAATGLAGDRHSLGFLAETERQVCAHLDGHLQRLPAADAASRAIVRQMRAEEAGHQQAAEARGAAMLPWPARLAMRSAARVMTTVAHYL